MPQYAAAARIGATGATGRRLSLGGWLGFGALPNSDCFLTPIIFDPPFVHLNCFDSFQWTVCIQRSGASTYSLAAHKGHAHKRYIIYIYIYIYIYIFFLKKEIERYPYIFLCTCICFICAFTCLDSFRCARCIPKEYYFPKLPFKKSKRS